MKYEVFFVVNDNISTRNPASGELFAGPWCESNGYQCATPKQAKPYYTKATAQKLADKLNKSGMNCPAWARKYINKPSEKGRYRVVEGEVDITMTV